jgi:hypothetical protein
VCTAQGAQKCFPREEIAMDRTDKTNDLIERAEKIGLRRED